MNVIVLIPAAGMGRRMGADCNKQYLNLADRPILAHTLALFDDHPRVERIYIISPEDEIPYCRQEIVDRYAFSRVRGLVAGGAERQDSVRNGLHSCEAAEDDIVVVHDGVRPFFPPQLLEGVIETAARVGGCVVGVPVKDTIKEVEAGMIQGTPQRSRLWQAQTPQAFRFGLLRDLHRRAADEGFCGTDDASLLEHFGYPVAMVEGDYRNIKITTPEDLVLARAFFASGDCC